MLELLAIAVMVMMISLLQDHGYFKKSKGNVITSFQLTFRCVGKFIALFDSMYGEYDEKSG